MKRVGLREKQSVFYIGKGVIILTIVVTSSLSFVLGFFVGKSTNPQKEPAPVEIPLASVVQQDAGSDPAQAPVQVPSQTPDLQTPAPLPPTIGEGQRTAEAQKETDHNPPPKKMQEKAKVTGGNTSQEAHKTSKKVRYTVQTGAFKNEAEADSMKEKLSKKGYKVFVVPTRGKQGTMLYKVMIGEFSNRKEAELLSVRIKKGEGIRAFVTLKTD